MDRPLNEEDEEGQHRHKEDDGSASPSSSSVNDEDGSPPTLVPSALNKIFTANANELAQRAKASSRGKVGRRSNGNAFLDNNLQRRMHLGHEDDEENER